MSANRTERLLAEVTKERDREHSLTEVGHALTNKEQDFSADEYTALCQGLTNALQSWDPRENKAARDAIGDILTSPHQRIGAGNVDTIFDALLTKAIAQKSSDDFFTVGRIIRDGAELERAQFERVSDHVSNTLIENVATMPEKKKGSDLYSYLWSMQSVASAMLLAKEPKTDEKHAQDLGVALHTFAYASRSHVTRFGIEDLSQISRAHKNGEAKTLPPDMIRDIDTDLSTIALNGAHPAQQKAFQMLADTSEKADEMIGQCFERMHFPASVTNKPASNEKFLPSFLGNALDIITGDAPSTDQEKALLGMTAAVRDQLEFDKDFSKEPYRGRYLVIGEKVDPADAPPVMIKPGNPDFNTASFHSQTAFVDRQSRTGVPSVQTRLQNSKKPKAFGSIYTDDYINYLKAESAADAAPPAARQTLAKIGV